MHESRVVTSICGMRLTKDQAYLEPVRDVKVDLADALYPIVESPRRLTGLQAGLERQLASTAWVEWQAAW